jgi:hypothetical protein
LRIGLVNGLVTGQKERIGVGSPGHDTWGTPDQAFQGCAAMCIGVKSWRDLVAPQEHPKPRWTTVRYQSNSARSLAAVPATSPGTGPSLGVPGPTPYWGVNTAPVQLCRKALVGARHILPYWNQSGDGAEHAPIRRRRDARVQGVRGQAPPSIGQHRCPTCVSPSPPSNIIASKAASKARVILAPHARTFSTKGGSRCVTQR